MLLFFFSFFLFFPFLLAPCTLQSVLKKKEKAETKRGEGNRERKEKGTGQRERVRRKVWLGSWSWWK